MFGGRVFLARKRALISHRGLPCWSHTQRKDTYLCNRVQPWTCEEGSTVDLREGATVDLREGATVDLREGATVDFRRWCNLGLERKVQPWT